MASKNGNGVTGAVVGSQDGYLQVRAMEEKVLDQYLETYSATIEGYKYTPGEMFTNVTMKIAFPSAEREQDANLWGFFIVKTAHPTASKPRLKVMGGETGFVVFATWPIWNTVKYVISKNTGGSNFF